MIDFLPVMLLVKTGWCQRPLLELTHTGNFGETTPEIRMDSEDVSHGKDRASVGE